MSEVNIQNDFIDVVEKVKELFPGSKIMISSILPRGETHLKEMISNINDFMSGCCTGNSEMSFMNNINIKRHMLYDRKHVDYNGFRMLLANMRYMLFGKIPPRFDRNV